MDEIDIWRAAKQLIDAYGQEAPIQAAMRADAGLEEGNLAAVSVWKRVLAAIGQLQREVPQAGEALN